MTQPNQYEDKELREELRHVYGICDCDWKNMHCFYWSSNDPDFIDTLPQRQLDEAMQLITQKQLEARIDENNRYVFGSDARIVQQRIAELKGEK